MRNIYIANIYITNNNLQLASSHQVMQMFVRVARPYGKSDPDNLNRGVYFLISRVELAKEFQEPCNV